MSQSGIAGSSSSGIVTSITGDAGGAVTGAVTLTGGTSGAVFTGSGGNTLTESFNYLALPNTTTVAPTGQITMGANRFLSNYGTRNSFLGQGSGVIAGLATADAADNTGIGYLALSSLVLAEGVQQNTAVGSLSCSSMTSGSANTAVGYSTLGSLLTGTDNVAIGPSSGVQYTGAESNNILLNHSGVIADSGVIRIGTAGTQTTCFVAGIRGVGLGAGDPVSVAPDGQLGTVISSRRYKENIQDMGSDSERLMKLRPVTFNLKADDAPVKMKRYGLIAEEVAEVFPELASYDAEGNPHRVKYEDLAVMLLNEFQKLKKNGSCCEQRIHPSCC